MLFLPLFFVYLASLCHKRRIFKLYISISMRFFSLAMILLATTIIGANSYERKRQAPANATSPPYPANTTTPTNLTGPANTTAPGGVIPAPTSAGVSAFGVSILATAGVAAIIAAFI
ncbi:hypothetical protein F5884DRAFT_293769 [Xylogone sp. PMI_703]|nr:hypothetical protein F5884DRAFT_293769 [Xylogone sp. PMI_703]